MAAASSKLLLLFIFFYTSQAQISYPYPPNSLVLPVNKDPLTLQYLINIYHGTTPVPIALVVDIGGPFLWLDCGFSGRRIGSCSIQCLKANGNGCGNSTVCDLFSENSITKLAARGELVEDTIAIAVQSNANAAATIHDFMFSCAPTFLLKGLARGARGMLGLGRTQIALPSQHHHHKFSLCLSSEDGVIISGNDDGAPPNFPLMYTPLVSKSNKDYFINVKSVKIHGKPLSLGHLGAGVGGGMKTKISTIVPYTTMERSIFSIFIKAYAKAATVANMTRAPAVAPFELCFRSAADLVVVPTIDLVLQSSMVKWRVERRNSMVKVSDEVMCLGFLDGGLDMETSIVLGGYQLEDVLLRFDLGTSMLGFSSSLLMKQNSCSQLRSDLVDREEKRIINM